MSVIQKHIARNLPPYLFLVSVGLLSFLGPEVVRVLRFERSGILAGQYYRLLSGHFVHLGPAHALMDLSAAVLLWIWFREVLSPKGWIFSVLASALLISAMFLAFSDVAWYVGLSGILHGMLLLGTVRKKSFTPLVKALVLAALFLKIGMEQLCGASAKTVALIGGEVVVDAHLFGAVAGILIWCALLMKGPGPSPRTDPA